MNYWLDSAKHDLEVAETLFSNEKYDWCLFISHLVLEKTLKACFVKEHNKLPPRVHNLIRLAEMSNLELSEEQKLFLDKVNDFNVAVRYPDYKGEFRRICNKEFCSKYFNKIKEFYQWLILMVE